MTGNEKLRKENQSLRNEIAELKEKLQKISEEFSSKKASLQSCYLIPTVDKPTRVHRNSATLIDNIFLNNPDQILLSGNIISDISDHFSQFCIIKAARDKYRGYTTKIRDFSNFSADQFNRELSEVDWECILVNHATDPDKLFSTFYKKFNKIVNKHAPITKLSKRKAKQLSQPWKYTKTPCLALG